MMDAAAAIQPVQGKVVGVIIPPPEIRAVVDKTAQFVAKNGKSFEQRILSSSEGKTAKFNFMKELDPYHAYYELRIRELEEAIAAGIDPNTVVSSLAPKVPNNLISTTTPAVAEEKKKTAVVSNVAKATIPNPIAMLAKSAPKEAPYPLEFCITHPTGVTAVDIEVIKLTAQFTAVNGREFLAGLAQREQRNPQFDFLKPTHLLFSYFTSLVDAYAKIVNPSEELKQRMQARKSRDQVLQLAVQRWSWNRSEEDRKRDQLQQEEAERASYAAVDWNDFTVVEVIEFRDDELLDMPALGLVNLIANNVPNKGTMPPPPMPPKPPTIAAPRPPEAPQPPPAPAAPPAPTTAMVVDGDEDEEFKVVANYQPRIATNMNTASTVIDPISGKPVPLDQLEEHMRIQLLDPKWKEQQRRFQEKQMTSGSLASAEGRSIADALKTFAKRRGDIFGQAVGGEGSDSARAIAEEEQREKERYEEISSVQWDGHQGTAMTVQQMKNELSNVSAAPQQPPPPPQGSTIGPSTIPPLPALPVAAPFYPPPPPVTTMGMPMPPPPPTMPMTYGAPPPPIPMPTVPAMPTMMPPPMMFHPAPPAAADDHTAKKARLADRTNIVSEEEWIARYPDPIQIQIQLPNDPSSAHWNLNGQTVMLVVVVTKTTKEVKEQLCAQHLNNMPVGKIQLKTVAQGFWKEGTTLATMNIAPNVTVEASLKARGGKR